MWIVKYNIFKDYLESQLGFFFLNTPELSTKIFPRLSVLSTCTWHKVPPGCVVLQRN